MDYMSEINAHNRHLIQPQRRSGRKAMPHIDMTNEELVGLAELSQRFEAARRRIRTVQEFRAMNHHLGYNIAQMVRPLIYYLEEAQDNIRQLQALVHRLTRENANSTETIARLRTENDALAVRTRVQALYDE
jgi:hypothetical protein